MLLAAVKQGLSAMQVLLCLGMLLAAAPLNAQSAREAECIEALTMNVQYFFVPKWEAAEKALQLKFAAVAKAIRANSSELGPDIMFLQEVENRAVLKRWVDESWPNSGYSLLMKPLDEEYNLNTAILTRLPIIEGPQVHPIKYGAGYQDKRGLLQASLKLPDGKALSVATVHAPVSRVQLVVRQQLFSFLTQHYKETLELGPVLIGGDINITSNEWARIAPVLEQFRKQWSFLHEHRKRNWPPGTYYYGKGKVWSHLDQLIVNKFLYGERCVAGAWCIEPESIRIGVSDPEQLFGAQRRPKRFKSTSGGVSDHFPFIAKICPSRAPGEREPRLPLSEESVAPAVIPEKPLPNGLSPLAALRRNVIPFMKNKVPKQVLISDPITSEFYELLSPQGKRLLHRRLDLRSLNTPLGKELLDKTAGGTLVLDKPVMKFIPRKGLIKAPSPTAVRELARLDLYTQGQALRMTDPNWTGELLFFPISGHNLRVYSGFSGGLYYDKAYSHLCKELDREIGLNAEQWLNFFADGFDPASMKNLDLRTQRIVLDMLGIYMAEYYKREVRSLKPEESPHLTGANNLSLILLQEYLSGGGSIVHQLRNADARNQVECSMGTEKISTKNWNYCLRKADFSFFECEGYRRKVFVRLLNERILGRYLKLYHAALWQKLNEHLPLGRESLFAGLSLVLEKTGSLTELQKGAFAEALKVFRRERDQIREYMSMLLENKIIIEFE